MTYYLITDVDALIDPEIHAEYRRLAAPTLEQYQVQHVVGTGDTQTIEGNWDSKGMAILAFTDKEHFERWYYSPEYQAVLPLRLKSLSSRSVLVPGC